MVAHTIELVKLHTTLDLDMYVFQKENHLLHKKKQSSVWTNLVDKEEINFDDKTEEEYTDRYKSSDETDDENLKNEDDNYFDI